MVPTEEVQVLVDERRESPGIGVRNCVSIGLQLTLLAIIGKRIFLDFRRPATGHANLVSGVGSAEMDRSSG